MLVEGEVSPSAALPYFRTSLPRALCIARLSPCAPPCFDSDRATSPPMPGVGGLNILLVG